MNVPIVSEIKDKIHTIRGHQVILDNDLAELYDVPTKALNQSVKRNLERFPPNFMFKLTEEEHNSLRSQFVTIKNTKTIKRGEHRKYLPYAFTEQGVSMLSGLLKSKTAIQVSINIMNVFVAMREFISANVSIFSRLSGVEKKQIAFELKTEQKFEKVFDALQTKEVKQGIFYNGQIFDAYAFVCNLIKKTKREIILIDNYIDESVLTLLSKRKKGVSVIIYTKIVSKQLLLDLEKFNSQYEAIAIKEFNNSHDRFIIIDNEEIYHFGASLKDLGKKWFAFSKFEKEAIEMLRRLK